MEAVHPHGVTELPHIDGLVDSVNAEILFLLYRHAGVRSLADLRKAIDNPQHLLGIPEFGPRRFARMSQAIQ